ncbi:zinc-dependent metalloprotease [Algivirga pacifica]|uniref:Por secretion system C-terminal sorting domain-containing protein n=1 Tax=Algivirga pacifica TaxID=1162670 RepID=A0ABP9CYZ5_9BACT
MSFYRYYFFIILLAFAQQLQGQSVIRCAHDLPATISPAQRNNTKIYQRSTPIPNWHSSARRSATSPIILPVVIHVIHSGIPIGTGENLPYEQLVSQVHVLNQDFNGFNADTEKTPDVFKDVVIPAEEIINFKLSPVDPIGNVLPEAGINRVNLNNSEGWDIGDLPNLMAQTQWDPYRFLNIWIVKFRRDDLLGLGYFPVSNQIEGLGINEGNYSKGTDNYDGIVIDYKVFGDNRQSRSFELRTPFNWGRTTTHEVGHYLGLLHPWGEIESCQKDDFVLDTPLIGKSHGDIGVNTSCVFPGPEACEEDPFYDYAMFQNFMDYPADSCMYLFTKQQQERMLDVLSLAPRRNTLNMDAPSVSLNGQAVGIGDNVRLSWNRYQGDEQQEGNAVYVVERSFNNFNFETIAIIDDLSQTSLEDEIPAISQQYYFYRIYVANAKGFSSPSNLLNTDGNTISSVAPEEVTPLKIYPNPTRNQLSVTVPLIGEPYTLRIFDLYGRVLIEKRYLGSASQTIDTTSLTAGPYVLQVQSEGQRWVERFLKQ